MDNSEIVLFFQKPHVPYWLRPEVKGVFLGLVSCDEEFKILREGSMEAPLEEFLWAHYKPIHWWPRLGEMIHSFVMEEREIDYLVLAGNGGLITTCRDALGDKHFKNAEPGTIRRLYMDPDGGDGDFNTVAHVSSNTSDAVYEINNLHKFGILNKDYAGIFEEISMLKKE